MFFCFFWPVVKRYIPTEIMIFVNKLPIFKGVQTHTHTHARARGALNTFYLRLYGVGHYGKEPLRESERGNPLPPLHGLLFDCQQGFFYMYHPTDRIADIVKFVTPIG